MLASGNSQQLGQKNKKEPATSEQQA